MVKVRAVGMVCQRCMGVRGVGMVCQGCMGVRGVGMVSDTWSVCPTHDARTCSKRDSALGGTTAATAATGLDTGADGGGTIVGGQAIISWVGESG